MNHPVTTGFTLHQASAEGADAQLLAEIRKAPVVIFRSRLSDVRELTDWLEGQGVAHAVIDMPMGDPAERARFHRLEQITRWQLLPQVFVNGEFVGGERELRRRLAAGTAATATQPDAAASPVVQWLGYGGLIPFLAAAAVLAASGDTAWRAEVERLLLGYAAVILSFLGAVHWGRLLGGNASGDTVRLAVWGVLPSVFAWFALFLPFAVAAPVMAALFAGVFLVDRQLLGHTPLRRHYLPLRLRLTSVVVASLLVGWLV